MSNKHNTAQERINIRKKKGVKIDFKNLHPICAIPDY